MTRLVAAAMAIGFSVVANAAPDETSTSNDYGNVGLLQTPTARFSGAGELRIGYASALPYNSPFISAQPFDWLEATFRYTTFNYKGLDGGPFLQDGFLDKSFDVKVGLLGESIYMPAIALGIQDVGGTGLLASEFLVASKRFGDWDLTFGLGWGRLGARGGIRNPLVAIDDSFATREGFGGTGRGDFGGEFEFEKLFSGERMDVFGGLRWAPEGSPWSFEIERDGNDYSLEPFNNDLPVDFPVNAGVAYAIPGFGARVGWVRGDQLAFSLYFANDVSARAPKPLDPPPTPVAPKDAVSTLDVSQRSEAEAVDDKQRRAIRDALKRQHIQLLKIENAVLGWQQNVWVAQSRYRDEREVLGRVARTLSMLADQRVARFQIVLVAGGLEQSRAKVDRKSVQRVASKGGALGLGVRHRVPARISLEPVLEDPSLPSGLFDIDWFTGPRYRQSLGDPDESYRAGLYWPVSYTPL
ncbi:YjbH domain-containing protein, partial [bacterium]|nr:YjbH domain-containing protein [bacterium]